MKIHNLKLKMVALVGLTLLIGGCSSKTDAVYQDSMQNGLDAIAEDNFNEAEGFFMTALNLKENDIKAKAYLTQVQLIIKADELMKQNKVDDALQSLVEAIKVKEGSKVIASKSHDKKELLIKSQEKQKSYNSILTDAKSLTSSGDYLKSNGKLDELLKTDLTQFVKIKDEAAKLKQSNDEAIEKAAIEKAEKEAQVKATAEAQARVAAEAQANDPLVWAPGIKEAFEKKMIENEYVEPDGSFFYRNGYIGGDNQGYFSLYTTDAEYGERYVVTVNVKTGWYHG